MQNSTTLEMPVTSAAPTPCPSCGHCPTCGNPGVRPYPGNPRPYVGDVWPGQPHVWTGTTTNNPYSQTMTRHV